MINELLRLTNLDIEKILLLRKGDRRMKNFLKNKF
jgi:hypothetical protein